MLLLPPFTWTLVALPLGVSAVLPSHIQKGGNTSGAILFFSYILAALYFTTYIVFNISRIETKHQLPTKSGRGRVATYVPEQDGRVIQDRSRRSFRVFSALAVASFAVLSWNMSKFLIVSYERWASAYGLPAILRLQSFRQTWRDLHLIWTWATGSNPFQTFAEDLVSDPAQWKVVRAALIYSYTSNSWMSAQGNAAKVPDLWAYFVLDQILPVSFTQNLFCIALTRTTRALYKIKKAEQDRLVVFCVRSAGLLCYLAALHRIPATVNTGQFFPTLFTLRFLLFTPYLVEYFATRLRIATSPNSRLTAENFNKFLVAMSITFSIHTVLSGPRTDANMKIKSVNMNYAVAALSHDLLIGSLGGATYLLLC